MKKEMDFGLVCGEIRKIVANLKVCEATGLLNMTIWDV